MDRQQIISQTEALEREGGEGSVERAIAVLDRALEQGGDDAELYYRRGRLNWRLGRRGDAMSDYRRSVALDPASPAAQALEMSTGIMDFYNRDLYNP